MDLSSIALQGLAQAEADLQASANALAQRGASQPDGTNLDTLTLSAELLALMAAQNQFTINLVVLKTSEQMQGSLVNLVG